MADRSRLGDMTVVATFFGFVLLNQPLVGSFDAAIFAGIPGSVAYIFSAWALLIAMLAWIMRPRPGEGSKPDMEG